MTLTTRWRALLLAATTGSVAACGAPHVPARHPGRLADKPDEPEAAAAAYVCSSIAVPSASPLPDDPASGAVVRVDTRGFDEPKKVCHYLHTSAGGAIDTQKMDADVHALYETGLFDDIDVVRETVAGGVALTFEMKPRRSFASTRIDGAHGLPNVDKSLLPEPGLLDPAVIEATRRSLKDNLALAGYRHSDVLVTEEPREDGAIELVFRVEANVQTRVRTVTFDGSGKLRDADLIALMQSAPGNPASDDVLARDALVLTGAYYDHGMLQAEVSDPELVESRDGAFADITIRIHEGDVFRIGSWHVAGELLDAESEYIRHFCTLKPGDVFSRTVILADLDRIREYQRARGFPSNVEPVTVLNSKKKEVDITLRVTPSKNP